MICKICGAQNPDGNGFCNDCGAPLLIEYVQTQNQQRMSQPMQPQVQQGATQQPVQPQQSVQARSVQPQVQQGVAHQPVQSQQSVQPQQSVQARPVQPQIQQNMVQQPVRQQQNMQQNVQASIQQGVPQQAFRNQLKGIPGQQPAQQQIFNQQPYVQQQQAVANIPNNSNQQKIKKGKSGGVVAVILILLLLAVAAGVFFIFVFPKLSKSEPKGEYSNRDFGGYILFDDGVYAVYDDEGGYEFGTYEVNSEKITFTDVNGNVDYGKYNKKDNTVEYGYIFESKDTGKTFDVKIDKKYVSELKSKIKNAAESALSDSEVLTEAEEFGASYYIYGNELRETNTAFAGALADKLGYSGDAVLSYLIENGFITLDISVNTASKTADIKIY